MCAVFVLASITAGQLRIGITIPLQSGNRCLRDIPADTEDLDPVLEYTLKLADSASVGICSSAGHELALAGQFKRDLDVFAFVVDASSGLEHGILGHGQVRSCTAT